MGSWRKKELREEGEDEEGGEEADGLDETGQLV